MLKRFVLAVFVFGLFSTGASIGQLCVSSHTTDLYCLLPAAFHTAAAPFNAFYTPFGTELSQLPTAKPAGLVLKFEKGVLAISSESLGEVFSERAETIGRRRLFVGFTFQHFGFGSIDGTNLRHIPIILTFPPTGAVQVYTVTNNRIDVKANQYTLLGTIGLTDKVDFSVAIPIERISMSASVAGTEYATSGGATAAVNEYVPGSSSGIGDVILGGKGNILDRNRVRVAVGVDFRIPSGDELNFLGSGTVGVKPYVAVTRAGRISPHVNLGYQWNGDSVLNANTQGRKQQLPTDFFYSAGVDITTARVTLVADLLGEHYFDAPRLSKPTLVSTPAIPQGSFTVVPFVGSYTANDLGLGFKTRTFAHLVLTGNILIKVNSGGLRAQVVPLAGASYSF